MIRTILLYDDKDADLGAFFELCAHKNQSFHNPIIKHKSSGNRDEIEASVSKYNNHNFIFISYLHGDDGAMYLANKKIVSVDNAYLFINAFCYTFSCYCGRSLSHILLENKALIFWGYKDKAYTMPAYEEDFAELAVSG